MSSGAELCHTQEQGLEHCSQRDRQGRLSRTRMSTDRPAQFAPRRSQRDAGGQIESDSQVDVVGRQRSFRAAACQMWA